MSLKIRESCNPNDTLCRANLNGLQKPSPVIMKIATSTESIYIRVHHDSSIEL